MRIPMLFATNEKFVPYCCVAIASILEHASPENEYVFYIFYSEMSEGALAQLRALGRGNARIEPMCVEGSVHGSMRAHHRFSKESYFRLMGADLLPNEEKLLYLDCDIVALEDVAQLFSVDIGDNIIGAVMCHPLAKKYMEAALGIQVEKVFYSGVILINTVLWRQEDMLRRCMDALEKNPGIRFPDQDSMAIACRGRAAELDPRWNQVSMPIKRHGVVRGGIVHLAGGVKPANGARDTDFAYYYETAARIGCLPPETPPMSAREVWVNRHFNGLRPAFVRTAAKRAGGAAYAVLTAYAPRFRRCLKRVRVSVTTRCPASCAHCEMLCPHLTARAESSAEQVIADLKALFACTRSIDELCLTGGEPFARPDFASILRFALESGRAKTVVVETPGLAQPSAEAEALLRDARVRVEIHTAEKLFRRPDDEKVPPPNWVWADFGPLERRECDSAALYWQARACGADDWFYLDGRLYPCPRAALGAAMGKIPESACRFADLRREKGAWRRAKALADALTPRPMEACRYCLRGTVDFLPVQSEISETHSVKG